MTLRCDIVVVGAGIVGAAVAAALAEAGAEVVIVDRAPPGGGTTAAGMGHLVAMDDSPAQFALTVRSLALWRALSAGLPTEVEWDTCGTIWVAADEAELAEATAKHAAYAAGGVATTLLDATALAAREPALRRGLAGGLLVPGDAVIYPPAAAAVLLARAERHGARALLGREVAAVGEGGVLLADGEVLEAGRVVVAAGATSPALVAWPRLAEVLRPRKGHLAISARAPGYLRHQLVELGYLRSAHGHDDVSVAFNLQPRRTGQVLIGSSRQYDRADAAVEGPVLARMLRRALDFAPTLAELEIRRVWTGFRPATPDSLPLIGPLPSDARTWLATGHEGLGITTALGTAELVAAALGAGTSPLDPAPFLPARFEEVARDV
ncbi:MAG: FAD-dependent oxidoreductase [Planctomycetota bacterium]